MSAFSCAVRACLISVAISVALPARGQAVPAPAPTFQRPGWLYRGSDIPPDPDWHLGTLANGLRYAVRRNGVPPGQVAIRVRIAAGSLDERDDERGFAHLIEHLSFRGSKQVPDSEAKRIWQRLGVTFGSDSNAQTTPTETVYKLDLPDATPASLDESLALLAGMMANPSLDAHAIDAERPVVLAERRERESPAEHFADLRRRTFFAGQRLAEREPIGTLETLQAATPAAVTAFHDRWYRPDRAVVAIVGDIDPTVAAQLLAKHFAAWQGQGPAPAEPDLGAPDPHLPATGASVEPTLPPVISMGVVRPWQARADTVLFNRKRFVDQIALRVIDRRLETRARAGGSFLQAETRLDDVSRSVNGTFVDILPVGDDWKAALADVRAVIADAKAHPAAQAAIDREVADVATGFRNAVATAAAESGADLADTLVDAVDIGETTASAKTANALFQGARDAHMFTPATVMAATRRLFDDGVVRAVINTHEADSSAAADLATALAAPVAAARIKTRAEAAIDFSALPKLGPAGTIASRAKPGDFGLETVAYTNGVRLLMLPSKGEANRVYVRVRFGRGYAQLPADRQTLAWSGDLALVPSGIGALGQDALDRLTTGRQLGIDFAIDDDAFVFGALTSPQDLADELRLIATKLAEPGWDPAPVNRARASALLGYAALSASPDGILARDLKGLLHAGDARWVTPSRAEVAALDAKDFKTFWEPILAAGPIEVDIFGDIDPAAAVAAVTKTFGAMKPRIAAVASSAATRFPAHVETPVVRRHEGPADQAVAVIAWPTGSGIENIAESYRLDVLAAVMRDRLLDQLRSAAGASYSPNVESGWPVGLSGGGALLAIGKVPPDKVDLVFRLTRAIAADLVAHPLGTDEMKRIMLPMGQSLMRASTSNQFWLDRLGGASFDPRRITAIESLGKDFSAITAAQLQATAAKYLRPDADWTLAVLPEKAAAPTAGGAR